MEQTLFLGDGPTGYVLNGKGFPATQPIVAALGDTVLIHLANDGSQIHPMHLHGLPFRRSSRRTASSSRTPIATWRTR